MISYGPGLVFPDAWGGRPEEELEEYGEGCEDCEVGCPAAGGIPCGAEECVDTGVCLEQLG